MVHLALLSIRRKKCDVTAVWKRLMYRKQKTRKGIFIFSGYDQTASAQLYQLIPSHQYLGAFLQFSFFIFTRRLRRAALIIILHVASYTVYSFTLATFFFLNLFCFVFQVFAEVRDTAIRNAKIRPALKWNENKVCHENVKK